MRQRITDSVTTQIKERLSIVDLVESYVSLKRSGKNFVGLCPFHDDTNPSLQISEDKGLFHCFSCGAGGDIFGFYMRYNNIPFPEAVSELAKRVGVELASPPKYDRQFSAKKSLYKINSLASQFFCDNLLNAKKGKKAMDYVSSRGLTREIVEQFKVGYAPDSWDGLGKFLNKNNVSSANAESLGLVIKRKNSDGYYDRFRDRVIFPITDVESRVIGFGGRILGEGEPKYMNSPESALYSKGNILYGLDASRDEIRRTGTAVIVEGYMDYLSLYRSGITGVVASSGTSLTGEQVQVLKRFAKNVVLVFDSDKAGVGAAIRLLKVFLTQGLSPRIVSLPDGEDPDSFVSKNDASDFEELVAKSPLLIDFYIEHALSLFSNGEVTRKEVSRDVLEVCGFISDPIEKSHYVKYLAEAIGVRENELLDILSKNIKNESKIPRKSRFSSPPREVLILKILLNYAEIVDEEVDWDFVNFFKDENIKAIVEKIVLSGVKDISSLLLEFNGIPQAQELISNLVFDSGEPINSDNAGRLLADCARKIELGSLEDRLRVLRLKIGEAQKSERHELHDSLLKEYRDILEQETALKGRVA